MPPLTGEELEDGRVERTVAVGLRPRIGGRMRESARTPEVARMHEIVGVNMAKRKLVRFEPNERVWRR